MSNKEYYLGMERELREQEHLVCFPSEPRYKHNFNLFDVTDTYTNKRYIKEL